jgi:hypothetical protein
MAIIRHLTGALSAWHILLRQGGTLLCALIVILVFEGLQNDGVAAADRTVASKIEAMNLVLSENIIVIQAAEEPQTRSIAAYGFSLRNGGVDGRAIINGLRRVAAPDHIFRKIFSGDGEGWRVCWSRGHHRIDYQLSDYSRGFPIIFETIGDQEVFPAGESAVFTGPKIFNDFDDPLEVVVIDDNIEAGALSSDQRICGFFGGNGGSLSSPREIDRKHAENDRENSDEYSRYRDDFLFVVMNKDPRPIEPDFERGVRGGAVIFIGICCLLAFACWFWWLIARRIS